MLFFYSNMLSIRYIRLHKKSGIDPHVPLKSVKKQNKKIRNAVSLFLYPVHASGISIVF